MSRYALVLAAGRGERIGGPKALLAIDGLTLAERHVQRALVLGFDRVVLVVRPEVAALLDASACPALTLAISEAPDPAGSLAVGMHTLAALAEGDRVLVTPVDAFPASEETCTSLLHALDAGARAATPLYKERSGHPVICHHDVLASYRSASPAQPLRAVLHALGPLRVRVPVNDPAIAVDLDTPDDLRRWTGDSPQFAERVVFCGAHLHV